VGRDQANRASIQKAVQDARRADKAIVRVGAVKQLVEQEEQRHGPARDVGQLAQPRCLLRHAY
jgi:DNA-binding transcriptional regulator LsrR (DeoR family)